MTSIFTLQLNKQKIGHTFLSYPYQSKCCFERCTGRRKVESRTINRGPSWTRNMDELSFLDVELPCDASTLHKSPLATKELSML
jgi:hypothetical protein